MPPVPAIKEVRDNLTRMSGQFAAALPSHISPDKFQRVAITAIQQNQDLLNVNRQSLYGACIQAAQQGLLPDGREGAIVKFGQSAQFMPMVAGVLKKIRNSGQISTIDAIIVREKDHFRYNPARDAEPDHEPDWFGDRGKVVGVYAVAKLKDGSTQVEVMSVADLEKVRNASRSKDSGPWKQWPEEMYRKTVIRRLAKYLPQSTDREDDEIERVFKADDVFYEPETPVTETPEAPKQKARNSKLQAVVDAEPEPEHDVDTGEIVEAEYDVEPIEDDDAF